MITFQELILRLIHFWEKQGCVIHQGYDLEVGAGTFNPATFLRCLGPEPYKAAYVEPSRRPSDGRYGQNPNRVQFFHQFQVIIKPSLPNIQELYLQSLEAVGLKLEEHDIRFVHDDWESPTQGAWGLGWEVWIDGMEATQFTYFQMMGSVPLNPISVELTYGLERLAMFLQQVDHILDVHWNNELTFKDISYASEVEWSTYNFERSDFEMWRRHFDDFEREAKRLIVDELPLAAYDFVIKSSHAFNMLEARGVISVTERNGYITRIRDLARLIAAEYLASREKLGFPILKMKKETPTLTFKTKSSFNPEKQEDFLLEIGSEELPAAFIPIGMRNLKKCFEALLKKEELPFNAIFTYATPRRLTILVQGLPQGIFSKTCEKKGPKVEIAFDPTGKVTPQGRGFFKSIGIEEITKEDLTTGKFKSLKVQDGYLFFSYIQEGKSTLSLLSKELPSLIENLEFPKKMRWGQFETSYARPIHWIVALFGYDVVPFQIADVISDRISCGHAQLKPKKIKIKSPNEYLKALKKVYVLADREKRKEVVLQQLENIEKSCQATALEKERVLNEVVDLTEWPQLAVCSFDPKFLGAPQEVLISEMVHHQRYFPLAASDGKLLPSFIITADNFPTETILKGNQKVLSARLSDGVFLFDQDQKVPLESFNDKLKKMVFQKDLGTVFDKVLRLTSHVKVINDLIKIADDTKCLQGALLAKADLATALVKEFPDLQGTIGKNYALKQHLDPEVAESLEEHYFPRSEGGALPKTPCGIVLSLAEKVDNFLGYFSVGLIPTSSSDPYSLRRQGFGLIKILLQNQIFISLEDLLDRCSGAFSQKIDPKICQDILLFLTARSKTVFEEMGFSHDAIEAALQGRLKDPYDQLLRLRALIDFRKSGHDFNKLIEVFKRAKGILEERTSTPFNPSLAKESAEQVLAHALDHLAVQWKETLRDKNYLLALQMVSELQEPLAKLFDTVRILADEPELKINRIALVQKIFSLFDELLDFRKIQR